MGHREIEVEISSRGSNCKVVPGVVVSMICDAPDGIAKSGEKAKLIGYDKRDGWIARLHSSERIVNVGFGHEFIVL